MSMHSIVTSTIWLKLECERMRSVIITSVDGTALARERLRRLVLFGRLARGAIGYCRSGNCSREASVEGKMRDSGCQLSLSDTVTDCAMKMRRELIHPSQADQCRDNDEAAVSL